MKKPSERDENRDCGEAEFEAMAGGVADGFAAMPAGEDGIEEVLDLVVPAEGSGNADPSADDREDGEDDEREEHDPRRFVDAVMARGLLRGRRP